MRFEPKTKDLPASIAVPLVTSLYSAAAQPQAIDGVDEGVTEMQVGERRKLIVPPKLSKRATYQDGLSPDAMLY